MIAEPFPVVFIARHGQTTWNVAGRYQGRLESPLSDLGEQQAIALASAFPGTSADVHASQFPSLTRIVSSPLGRCVETARPTSDALGLALETDERLLEIAHGSWEGLLRDEIIERDAQTYRAWREHPSSVAFEGGETLAEVADRWNAFAAELAERDEVTLVVTHDAVVRVALLALRRLPLDDLWNVNVENAGMVVVGRNDKKLVMLEESHVQHLRDLRASIAGQAL